MIEFKWILQNRGSMQADSHVLRKVMQMFEKIEAETRIAKSFSKEEIQHSYFGLSRHVEQKERKIPSRRKHACFPAKITDSQVNTLEIHPNNYFSDSSRQVLRSVIGGMPCVFRLQWASYLLRIVSKPNKPKSRNRLRTEFQTPNMISMDGTSLTIGGSRSRLVRVNIPPSPPPKKKHGCQLN